MISGPYCSLVAMSVCLAAPGPGDLDSPIGWGPGARYIAYLTDQPGEPAGRWQVRITDTEFETTRVILRSADPLSAPSWSPDGKKIALFRAIQRDGGPGVQLQIVTPQGRLLSGFATGSLVGQAPEPTWLSRQQPQWSPNASQITMAWWHQGQTGASIMDLATRQAVAHLPRCVQPVWSADGHDLFFRKSRQLADPVFAWDVRAGTERQVWGAPVPTWRPGHLHEQRDLVVLSADGRATTMSLVRPEGTPPRQVAKWPIARELLEYVVSADGRAAAALFRATKPKKDLPRMHVVPINLRTRTPERAIPVLQSGTTAPRDRLPHALSICPLGIQVAVRYRLPDGHTEVGLFNLRTGEHGLVKHKAQAMANDLRENLAQCRRLTGQPDNDPALATPDLATYQATPRDARREVILVAMRSLNLIESQCRSYRPKDMPTDLLGHAAQFHLFAGHTGQSLRCLRELQRRDPAVGQRPDFLLFQAKCFVLQRTYLDAVAATKLMLTDPKLTTGQRHQARTLLAMSEQNRTP